MLLGSSLRRCAALTTRSFGAGSAVARSSPMAIGAALRRPTMSLNKVATRTFVSRSAPRRGHNLEDYFFCAEMNVSMEAPIFWAA